MPTHTLPTRNTPGAILALTLAAAPALAGGGPENLIMVVDPSNPTALHAANYYRDARNVPTFNTLPIEPGADNYTNFAAVNIPALLGTIDQRNIDDHTDFVLVMPGGQYRIDAPGLVSDSCSPISRFSIGGCYTSAFIADEILAGGMRQNENNRYYGLFTVDIPAFDSNTTYLSGSPSTSEFARRYLIGSMLGYTSNELGNTLEELLDMIDRAVAADGTHPSGTFYYMNNTADPARNVRSNQWNPAVSALAAEGFSGEVINGTLPIGRHDALGVMSGFAFQNIDAADFTLLPGAFCDHLTSWAATFDNTAQVKLSQWIRKGAAGSVGTIEEPCNYPGKFPRAQIQLGYAMGMPFAEAAFRSLLFFPFQPLIYGDPLARPFAHIPQVSVPDAPAAPVSGGLTLTPEATTSHPTATIASFELLINGVSHGTIAPGESFNVNTRLLDEGAHDLRVLAYDSTSIKTVGRWVGQLDVDNTPHDASLAVNATTGNLVDPFQFTFSASGAPVQEVCLWHLGRIVAAGASTAPLTVHGQMLGAGPALVEGEVLFTDGTTARTGAVQLDIDPSGAPFSTPPVAFGYSRTVSPLAPFVLELPTTHTEELDRPAWAVTNPPDQATLLNDSGAYRVVQPDPGATGSDSMQFRMFTPTGQTSIVTITLNYQIPPACAADLAEPFGVLDFSDVIAFLAAFGAAEPEADLAPPFDLFDFSDILGFLTLFADGCDA